MPIKWSAIKVSEAMDKVEAEVNKAVPFLEHARTIAQEAKRIDNLPQYIDQHLNRLIDEIERTIGDNRLVPIGRPRAAIESVRESIPSDAIEAEQAKTKYGDRVAMF